MCLYRRENYTLLYLKMANNVAMLDWNIFVNLLMVYILENLTTVSRGCLKTEQLFTHILAHMSGTRNNLHKTHLEIFFSCILFKANSK